MFPTLSISLGNLTHASLVEASSAVLKASQDELNQLLRMVVKLAKNLVALDSRHKLCRDFLELVGNIAGNLVIRLTSNGLFAQFTNHMMCLSINSEIPRNLSVQILLALKISLKIRDWEMGSSAINEHFDQLSTASVKAITTN